MFRVLITISFSIRDGISCLILGGAMRAERGWGIVIPNFYPLKMNCATKIRG